jgi:hypothetical protein
MEVDKTKIFKIPTREVIKDLVPPDDRPYLYDAWLLERWKDEEEKRVILSRTPAEQRLCWLYGIPAVGTPTGFPMEDPWLKFLISFPELVILEPPWGHETFAKAVTRALRFAEYSGQVKVVGFPVEVSEDENLVESVKHTEVQFAIEFNEMLDEAISKASVIDLNSLPSGLEQRVFQQALNLESRFSSVGVIMGDEDAYSFKVLTSYVDE